MQWDTIKHGALPTGVMHVLAGIGLPTDEVGVEHGAQDLLTLGEGAKDFGGGEGRVQEEAAAHAVEALAQQRGQDQ